MSQPHAFALNHKPALKVSHDVEQERCQTYFCLGYRRNVARIEIRVNEEDFLLVFALFHTVCETVAGFHRAEGPPATQNKDVRVENRNGIRQSFVVFDDPEVLQ